MDADVVVIGGGPVGLATALFAIRAGLVPIVLEPRQAPIDKACGEGLLPRAITALAGLGVEVGGRPFVGIRYVDRDRSVQARFRGEAGRGVRRTALHTAIAGVVEHAGITVVRSAMTDLTQDETGVHVTLGGSRSVSGSTSGTLRCRFVVAADGLHSSTRRILELDVAHRGSRRFGLRRHFRIEPWGDMVEVHWSPRAEAYITPVADDEVGVALLGSMRGSWSDRIGDFPGLQQRLVSAKPVSAVMGAGPLRQRSRSRRAGKVLLVGDAGGYVDALTGEGIALGLAQAEVAIRAIAADRPGIYCAAAAQVSLGADLLTTALLTSTRTVTGRRTVLAAAHRVPWLFERAVRTLAYD